MSWKWNFQMTGFVPFSFGAAEYLSTEDGK